MKNAYSLWKQAVGGSLHVWDKVKVEKKYDYKFKLFPYKISISKHALEIYWKRVFGQAIEAETLIESFRTIYFPLHLFCTN